MWVLDSTASINSSEAKGNWLGTGCIAEGHKRTEFVCPTLARSKGPIMLNQIVGVNGVIGRGPISPQNYLN